MVMSVRYTIPHDDEIFLPEPRWQARLLKGAVRVLRVIAGPPLVRPRQPGRGRHRRRLDDGRAAQLHTTRSLTGGRATYPTKQSQKISPSAARQPNGIANIVKSTRWRQEPAATQKRP